MKKFFVLTVVALLVAAAASQVLAQVDPRDSIILISKTIDTGQTGNAVFVMAVNITNKDSLTYLTLALRESTTVGTGYALLNRTSGTTGSLTFSSVVTSLTNTMNRGFSIGGFASYNNSSPDRFLVAGSYDPSDPTSIEPPNATEKHIWDIKFCHSSDSSGVVRFDSVRVIQSTGFTNTVPTDVKVNFVPSLLTITPTDVKDVKMGNIPSVYSLGQNYPNPFNANTQIQFALPKAGRTTLEIFNILGQKVNTLLNEYTTAGYKIVNWDGRDQSGNPVSSGVYFYRLRSENFLQTKKMLMIK